MKRNQLPTLTPVPMVKLRALMLDSYVEPILEALQEEDVIHLVDEKERASLWEGMIEPIEASAEIRRWQNLLLRIDRLFSELEFREELGLLDQLFKPREREPLEVSFDEEEQLLNEAEGLVDEVEREVRGRVVRYRSIRDFLWSIRTLSVRMDELRSSRDVLVKIGWAPAENLEGLENELQVRSGFATLYASEEGRRRYIVIVTLSSHEGETQRILEKYGLEEIVLPEELSGDPDRALRWIDDQVNNLSRRHERRILILYDAVQAKLARLRSVERLGRIGRVYTMEGWVPQHRAEEARTLIEKASEGYATVLLSPVDEPVSNVPSLLTERRGFSSFRILAEMYDVPAYNEIDPTPFLAVSFTIFVGLMSADIAVGLTVLLGGLLILRGAGTRSENMKSLAQILLWIGLSSIFFGFLTGEFFGGLIPLPVLWMSSAEQPIEFLMVAIVVGIVHITSGVFLGMYNNLVKRRWRRIVGEQISTLFLFAGGGILAFTGQFGFEGIGLVGYSIVFSGLGLLLVGQGLSGLLDITRLLSSVISYARLMAINMASAWMIRTFILVGDLIIGTPIVGLALTAVLLIFAHLFIVFISTFSTFAHSLRLVYVEFYGRFFNGGGLEFNPLRKERMYTTLRTAGVEG